MLSQQTINTVKSTAPLLAEHGQAITVRFYEKLFNAKPELKNIFNQINQQRGEQPRALADAVVAYAANIDKLETLLPAVSRIAHKHASLGISPEHYPIVGKYLLEAVKETLALPDDHAALTAWEQAYKILADIFIDTEEKLYQTNEQQAGGWRGFKPFLIDRIETETTDVKSFYLKPSDGSTVPSFKGGQYIGIKVNPASSDFDEIRQYSLSGKSGEDYLRISTKAEPQGLVSNHLHQSAVGDTVMLQPPTGIFNLDSEAKKHIFIAGGVGITPLMGMLHEVLDKQIAPENILFIQCARDSAHQVLKQELSTLRQQTPFHFKTSFEFGDDSDHQGYLNTEVIKQWLGETNLEDDGETAVYFCGPLPFMKALNQLFKALQFNPEAIHYETFGPTTAL